MKKLNPPPVETLELNEARELHRWIRSETKRAIAKIEENVERCRELNDCSDNLFAKFGYEIYKEVEK